MAEIFPFRIRFGKVGRVRFLSHHDLMRLFERAVRRSGIDATALFYTESDVSSEAEASIRNALRYARNRVDHSAEIPRDGRDSTR